MYVRSYPICFPEGGDDEGRTGVDDDAYSPDNSQVSSAAAAATGEEGGDDPGTNDFDGD